jgi:hypothetical protein
MSERKARLGEATRRAAERLAAEERATVAGAPRPGDLYTLAATAEHDVEWLVVTTADAGGWLLLPADLGSLAGSGDVEVPAGEPGGPLIVYCRFPVAVPAALLPAERRSGQIVEARRAAAERAWRESAAGGTPPDREPDHDPDHRRRLGELADARRALLAAVDAAGGGAGRGGAEGGGWPPAGPPAAGGGEAATPAFPARRLPLPPSWLTALAAALALLAIGLGSWNLRLQRRVDELSGARQVALGPAVVVDEVTRGGAVAVPDEEVFLLTLEWVTPPDPAARFRLTLTGPDGEELASIAEVVPELGLAVVEVPREALRPGTRLRLARLVEGGPPEPVLDRPLEVGGGD